jgi:hypothetical protein
MLEKHHGEKAYFYAKLNMDYFPGRVLFTTQICREQKTFGRYSCEQKFRFDQFFDDICRTARSNSMKFLVNEDIEVTIEI